LAFHGGGGAGIGFAAFSRLNAVAEREGFAVVYPDGLAGSWADGRGITDADRAGADDVRFVSDLVVEVGRSFPVDPRRVFAVGISNGGTMALRVACERAELVSAVAVVAASMPAVLVQSCRPARRVSVLVIHGTEDGLMPYGGGQVMGTRGEVIGARATAIRWAEWNGCATKPSVMEPPRVVEDGTRVVVETFPGPGGVDVELRTIEGGGHTWPGGLRYAPVGRIGRTSHNLDASEAIWAFFAAHGRPPERPDRGGSPEL